MVTDDTTSLGVIVQDMAALVLSSAPLSSLSHESVLLFVSSLSRLQAAMPVSLTVPQPSNYEQRSDRLQYAVIRDSRCFSAKLPMKLGTQGREHSSTSNAQMNAREMHEA